MFVSILLGLVPVGLPIKIIAFDNSNYDDNEIVAFVFASNKLDQLLDTKLYLDLITFSFQTGRKVLARYKQRPSYNTLGPVGKLGFAQ